MFQLEANTNKDDVTMAGVPDLLSLHCFRTLNPVETL